jgi:Ser/Thr protein kinase RdoA (MazF antagonist)
VTWQDLTPQQVLDALDAVGLRGDGRILQLNSYENRVFQLFLEDGNAVVAKFYRPGRWSNEQITEEHGFALELAAAEVPVVPPLVLCAAGTVPGLSLHGDPPTLACLSGHRFTVAERCAGREPELDAPGTLQRIGRFIGRLHAVGRRSRFAFRHHLRPLHDGRRALQVILDGGFVPPELLPAWKDACEAALALVVAAFDAAAPLATLRLHGDCHIGNVLWRQAGEANGPHVVDLDDAMQGPAVQDLWMLVSGDHATMARQLNLLLEGYEQFSEFDDRERALIEPLRTLRMVRHSAWLAERWSDPTFPINFPFFGSAAYWSQQTAQLREQVEAMGR